MNQWQVMKVQAAAKSRDMHDHLERKRGELRADIADDDARSAEGAAVDTLDYASWAVRQAELSVLDAIEARALARTGGSIRRPLSTALVRASPRHSWHQVAANVTAENAVVLVGNVRTQEQRDAVVGAAWLGHGLMLVIDELQITG